jgi:hypothetical protein
MPRKPTNPAQSPACPKCGCNQTELVRAGQRWGRPWATYACDHCAHEFSTGRRPQDSTNGHSYRVRYAKTKCPSCGSTNTATRSSPALQSGKRFKMRYHDCGDCGCQFSSYEEVERAN